jgi:hypothetical protein
MPRWLLFRTLILLALVTVLLTGAAEARGPHLADTPASPPPALAVAQDRSLATAGATPPWKTEAVDAPPYFAQMGPRGLALTNAGDPRIAYGGDHLYYASYYSGSWHVQTADASSGVGAYSSLALDTSDRARIAYLDGASDDLKYAYYSCNVYLCGWFHETVDTSGATGFYTSLALGSMDYPRISYYTLDGGTLRYAYKDASGWHLETVDSNLGAMGGHTSLALDSAGRPHISYYDATNYDLKYAWYDGSAWHTEAVDGATSSVGQYSSLAVDSNDRPRISYYDATNQDLKYAWYDGSAWHTETVDSGGSVGTFTSLALGAGDAPQISYHKSDGTYLRHAWYDGSWHSELVDASSDTGYYTSLVLGVGDLGRISYLDLAGQRIRYARYNGAQWNMETADSGSAFLGWNTSLATYPGGYRYISYFDSTHSKLKFAYRDYDPVSQSWIWEIVEVDDAGSADTSLALDSNGRPHISYVDETESDLLYTFYVGFGGNCGPSNSWRCLVADAGPNQVGWYSSIDLDSADLPHFSYYDATAGDLKYTYWDGTTWHPATVDSGGDVGKYTALKVDAGGNPHISYYDATNGHLKYAHLEGATWVSETVDSSAGSGECTSLALDGFGRPHIAYCGDSKTSLKYAWYDGATWQIVTVASAPYVNYASLALDAAGHAHISYYVFPTGNLWYAHFVEAGGNCGPGNTWQCALVDDDVYVGIYSSIALDEQDRPCISYQDNADGDLRYAEWGPMVFLPVIRKGW